MERQEDGGKAERDPQKGTKGLLLGPKETGPDGKALGTVKPLQPASPAFPMMAPIAEDDDGTKDTYWLTVVKKFRRQKTYAQKRQR